jgi:hypothetical protein
MLAIILAAAISSAPAAHVEDAFLTAVYVSQAERAERARLAAWLDEQDVVRQLALDHRANPFESDAKASPFAEDDAKPDPFDGQPKLFWWSTAETKTERW